MYLPNVEIPALYRPQSEDADIGETNFYFGGQLMKQDCLLLPAEHVHLALWKAA